MIDEGTTEDRREFLRDVSGALIAGSAAADAAPAGNDKFQPESFWKDRIQPPPKNSNSWSKLATIVNY